MPTLIVETGVGVENANSYISLGDARIIAVNYGMTLPTDDSAATVALINANRFLETLAGKLQGHAATSVQALSWPRNLVTVNGRAVPKDSIPNDVKTAQVAAANLISAGDDLFENQTGQIVTKEKVGPIETTYSDEYFSTLDGRPEFTAVTSFLTKYYIKDSGYRLTARHGY